MVTSSREEVERFKLGGAGGIGHQYLADLLDDLNADELTSMLNYLAIKGNKVTRANCLYFKEK